MNETRKTWNDYRAMVAYGVRRDWARYYARQNRANRDPRGKLQLMLAQRPERMVYPA